MSGQTTATAAAAGAVVAAAAGGELAQVFDQLAIVLALMGALGGGTHGVALRLPWSEVARGVLVGAGLAFGIGLGGPQVVGKLLAIDITSDGTVRGMAAAAFLVGFGQNIVVDWLRRGRVQ